MQVVLASIVTKTPHSNLAPSSMAHVDLACDLFKQVAAGSRPANTLVSKIVRRLHYNLKPIPVAHSFEASAKGS